MPLRYRPFVQTYHTVLSTINQQRSVKFVVLFTKPTVWISILVFNLFCLEFYPRLVQRVLPWIFNTLLCLLNFWKFCDSWLHSSFMFFENLQFYDWTPTFKKLMNVIISGFIWNLIKINVSVLIDKIVFMWWFFISPLFETFFETESFFLFNKFRIIPSFFDQHFIIFFCFKRVADTVGNLFLRWIELKRNSLNCQQIFIF